MVVGVRRAPLDCAHSSAMPILNAPPREDGHGRRIRPHEPYARRLNYSIDEERIPAIEERSFARAV